MATKATRLIDPQGRVILPSHIRHALNLQPGNVVEVDLDDDGTIKIKAIRERCCICGEGVEGDQPTINLTTGPNRKIMCHNCAQLVARKLLK